MTDDEMKQLLESLTPQPPTLLESLLGVAITCGRIVIYGALFGFGLKLAGF